MVCSEPQVAESIRADTINSIDPEVLREFVNNNVAEEGVKKLYKIDQTHIHDKFFRLNVWIKFTREDRVVSSFRIFDSFFVELTGSGDIIDMTIR